MLEISEDVIKRELEYPDSLVSFGYNPSLQSKVAAIAKVILFDIMQFRRISGPNSSPCAIPCQNCLTPHLPKIVSKVAQREPITFVLPAFPGKSPNPAKVLGPLPDMAERRALEFLQHLCDRIRQNYSPGAKIILCSDGRVFSDIVGMRDEDVTIYQKELSMMIVKLGLSSISTFTLEELSGGSDFNQMRSQLMQNHGVPLDTLREAVKRGGKATESSVGDQETHRLYCGITRFLVEDATFPGQKQSRSSIQKECRIRAYEVIQRSKAWSELIAIRFPNAVRLSIHPQSCGSSKLGIRLIEPDHWQTPWHGVAVDVGGRFVLLKRSQAETLGAQLVHSDGRPSHYILTDERGRVHLPKVSNEA